MLRTWPTTPGTSSLRVIKASAAAFTRMSAAGSVNKDRVQKGSTRKSKRMPGWGKMPYNVAASASSSHDYGLWIDAYTGCVGFALLNVNMCSTACLSTNGTDPFQCVETIVDGVWELVLGRHSVVNTGNNRIGVCS